MRGFAAAVTLVGTSLIGGSARAEHLVNQATIDRALTDGAQQRRTEQAALDRVLSAPQAARAAEALGADLGRVRPALSSLSDVELHDLSQRAGDLELDPDAGLTGDVETLLIVFLIVAIVILVLGKV